MAKLTIEIGAKISAMKKGLANASNSVKQWSRKISGFTKAAFGAAFVGVGAGIGALIRKSAQLAAQFEQIKVAFTTMTGSAERAKGLIAELNEFSKATPFSPDQVFKAGKTLLAFGFEAKNVSKTLQLLGDVSAGTGKDLGEMAVIFGQIKGAGRLMGQDLLQLINAGFNPLQTISEKTGKSMAQLKDEMSKGLITFDQVEGAFRDATSEGGKFFKMMENQSQTLNGQLSTLEGQRNWQKPPRKLESCRLRRRD
jgi:tape measure domain-containing protein